MQCSPDGQNSSGLITLGRSTHLWAQGKRSAQQDPTCIGGVRVHVGLLQGVRGRLVLVCKHEAGGELELLADKGLTGADEAWVLCHHRPLLHHNMSSRQQLS